ncbi:uncharacterized protein [Miscanthus floridulus]|uniref:uncharacterized protein n=1 Tax=Miscanthus floridulus TaxID=154761 RepID=UPI00345B2E9D
MKEDFGLGEVDARACIDGGRRRRCGLGRGNRRRDYLRHSGDVHQGPFLLLLSLGHMGRGLLFLTTAFSGPMALIAALLAGRARRRLSTTSVASARAETVVVVARRALTATTAAAAMVLPATVGAAAATGALLLATALATRLPVLLAEQESPHAVRDLLRLAAFLEHAQPPDDVLDRRVVQIEKHLEGDGGLRQAIGNHLQKFLYHFGVGDVVAEDAQVHGERRDPDPELGDGLAILEDERAELAAELLRASVARAAVTDPEHFDDVPRLLHGPLATERPPHLGGDRAQEARHCLAVLMVLIFIRVFVDADVDGVPDAEGLEIHLHHQRPFRVVRSREHRPRDVGGRALDDALHDP